MLELLRSQTTAEDTLHTQSRLQICLDIAQGTLALGFQPTELKASLSILLSLITTDMLLGMQYLASKNFVHRDLGIPREDVL